MRFLYTLAVFAALAAFAAPASAQRVDEQIDIFELGLRVTGSADISALITNIIGPADIPGSYFPQDTSASFYVAPSYFTRITGAGDTLSTGTVISGAGVTGQAVVALRADGTQAIGCMSAADPTTDIANAAAFAGKIAMIRRGLCTFVVKAQKAVAAGAIAFVIYNGDDRVGPADAITGGLGGGTVEGEAPISIPGVLVPNGIGQPIVDEVVAGGVVTLQIFNINSNAAEPGVGTTASGLEVRGANPFAFSTDLRLFTETAETVRVDVFNVRGQLVSTLLNGTVAGERAVTFSAADLAPGVYFVRAIGETFTAQQQLTVVR